MAWYEAHQTMAKHPKTLKLARLLKSDRRYAVGLLHDLFSWGLDAARKDGTLPGMSLEDIAAALDFSGKKGISVISALVDSGYLECRGEEYAIHDWYDYAGKLMDKREGDKRRKAEWKERQKNADSGEKEHGKDADGTRKERGIPLVTVPNRTVPNQGDYNISSTSTSASAILSPARAHDAAAVDEKFGRVLSYYEGRVIGGKPPGYIIQSLLHYCELFEENVVCHAFDIAIGENNRRWSYINGILSDYERNGIRSMRDVMEDDERHRKGQDKKVKKPPRTYGEASRSPNAGDDKAMEQLASLRKKMNGG